MIRAKINKIINGHLNDSKYFTFNDFEIKTDSISYQGTKITIIYEYDKQYSLSIIIPKEKVTYKKEETTSVFGPPTIKFIESFDYSIEGSMCPGGVAYEEEFKYRGIEGIGKAINLWLSNLWDDLTITPENRIFKTQKEEIEKIKEKVNGIPDEYFTAEEGKVLRERLEKLESQLAEKLSEDLDKKESKKQIDKLHNEIEVLKQTIPALKKSGWFKSLITKTMTWLADSKNQKLLKAGKDLVTSMLPEAKIEN